MIVINDNISCIMFLGGLKNTKRGIEKESMKEGIIKRISISECDNLTVLSYYVLGGLKTQKILTRKRN